MNPVTAALPTVRWKDVVVATALLWALLIVAVAGILRGTTDTTLLAIALAAEAAGTVVIVAAGVRTLHS